MPVTDALLEQLHETGRLHVVFSVQVATSQAAALDGSGAVLHLGASGQPVQLELDDYVDPEEDRHVYFASFTLTLRWRDDELLVFGAPGTGLQDPWDVPSAPCRSAVIRAAFRSR